MTDKTFHQELKELVNDYAHLVYKITRSFPKDELYGITSQLRRSALSVALNYIEGYARNRDKVHKNFLEISYGSLQESKFLIEFAFGEKYISESDYKITINLADRIGAMLWGMIKNFKD